MTLSLSLGISLSSKVQSMADWKVGDPTTLGCDSNEKWPFDATRWLASSSESSESAMRFSTSGSSSSSKLGSMLPAVMELVTVHSLSAR
uniref:Uncharacterized protein n=1 Tax=Globisporangium ultimum (strain ATCC 200006 / CBS 805.95 / DAOM BR144) TaxID=431595 RepID=K3WVT0_GLOUD